MTHLHARFAAPRDVVCRTVCGLDCGTVPVAYRNLNPEDADCPDCRDGLPLDTAHAKGRVR